MGKSELFVAAEKGDLDKVKELVAKGANPDLADEYGDVPINRAAVEGHLDVVKFLVEHGAMYHSPGIGLYPLDGAAGNGRLDVVKYLVEEKGVPVNQRTDAGAPPLIGAAADMHVDVVQYLVNKGADPNQRDGLGRNTYTTVEQCMQMAETTEEEKKKYQTILQILRKGKSASQATESKKRWQFWK